MPAPFPRRAALVRTVRRHATGSRTVPIALSIGAGVLVYAVAVLVFPHHSINHDEAVYLQQAELLLAGQLYLHPPVEDVFRPWFFVDGPRGLYPKYTPVPAAAFAVGAVVGLPRLALGAIAAAICYLTTAVGAELFDRRTGLLAAVFLVASPLFVVDAAVFLPYAPATALNLGFALGYLRADRTGRWPWAALAGGAIGLSFFARPYTAVLFAAPFVAHALWTLPRGDRSVIARQLLVAVGGLAGVVIALAYNALVTGDPLLFPYEAFAPRDGLGFGRRAILGYERTYTPALAIRANGRVLEELFTRWVVAGPVGTALAGVGLAGLLARLGRWIRAHRRSVARNPGRHVDRLARRVALAGLFVSVTAGNVFFWGNLNILGALADSGDGLIRYLGPYYHFDLLVPTAIFAAAGALALADGLRRALRRRLARRRAAGVGTAALLIGATVLAGVSGAALAVPLADNAANSQELTAAYEPVADGGPPGAVVFLPTPLGDWLNHPFQSLRNGPGYDGRTVYAIDDRPFAVADAFPDRRLYRYVYRGAWAPMAGEPVDARLQRMRRVGGQGVTLSSTVGLPADTSASIRLAAGDDAAYYAVSGSPRTLHTRLVVANGTAQLRGERVVPLDGTTAGVRTTRRDAVRLTIFVEGEGATGFSYRFTLPIDSREDGRIRALSPVIEVCRDPRLCGGEAAYIPTDSQPGVSVRTSLSVGAEGAA